MNISLGIFLILMHGAVLWILHGTPMLDGSWFPCHYCKRVWTVNQATLEVEYMVPLTWGYWDGYSMCPRCCDALMKVREIERETNV